ncbi:TetR/AcrR family transcriptional regulator [Patulibacter defluvii]|uniref:TetR/AcrR family transcriptional regulator n=1 Tax=Patulibacter defluvii TaxID=3095358 RepID=UPI002A7477E4|nr:TetR/AcrR family transcriptional regulator [Patulibacter sp. DM4]
MTAKPATRRRPNARGAIVEAAANVIARSGVRGLRVEHVAREAGISNALLYYYFADRSALVNAALNHANEQAPSMLDEADGGTGAGEVRRRLIAALMRELDQAAAVRDNSIVWNEVSASAVFEPALRDGLQRVTDAWNEKVARTIASAVAAGELAADVSPQDTAELLTGLIEGLSLRWLAGTLPLDRARELLARALEQHLPAP